MKKNVSILLTALFLMAAIPVFAAPNNSAIPADVLAYAQGEGLKSIKEFMKMPENLYVGGLFKTEAEIDALTLGQGYRLSYEKMVMEEWGETLKDSTYLSDSWLFSLDNGSGPVVYYGVTKDGNGKFSYFGTERAYNLSTALSVLKTLAENEGVSFAPIIMEEFGYYVAQDFNGDERIITVPGDAFRLDDSYLSVTRHEQLPTFKDYLAEMTNRISDQEYAVGEGIVTLLPDLSAEAPAEASNNSRILPAILCSAAAVLIVAAAVILGLRGKKKRESR
jgi:hypothetical protein